jgi:ribosomal protein S6--L-glutamate ligase
MEVNSSPGLEGIESVTGIDVARLIIKYLEKKESTSRSPRGNG